MGFDPQNLVDIAKIHIQLNAAKSGNKQEILKRKQKFIAFEVTPLAK